MHEFGRWRNHRGVDHTDCAKVTAPLRLRGFFGTLSLGDVFVAQTLRLIRARFPYVMMDHMRKGVQAGRAVALVRSLPDDSCQPYVLLVTRSGRKGSTHILELHGCWSSDVSAPYMSVAQTIRFMITPHQKDRAEQISTQHRKPCGCLLGCALHCSPPAKRE